MIRNIIALIILTIGFNVVNAQKTVATLKTEFDNVTIELPRQQSFADTGDCGDGYFFDVSPWVYMFQATGIDSYMDTAIDLFQRRIDASSLSSTMYAAAPNKTYYYNDSYYSWECGGPAVTGQCQGFAATGGEISLNETRGMRTVARMLWVLSNSPTYLAKGTNQTKYNTQLAWFQTNHWDKWESRGLSHIYRGNTHISAHWAQMGWFLHQITGTQKYRDAYEQISYSGQPAGAMVVGANIRDMIREVSLTGGNGYQWSGSFNSPSSTNDNSHANSEVELMVTGAEHSDYWTLTDMEKIIRNFDQVIYRTTWDNVPYYMNGVFSSNDGLNKAFWDQGWVQLGRFDSALQIKLEDAPLLPSYYYYQQVRIGNLAYNRAYLNDALFYPEGGTPDPGDVTAPTVSSASVTVDEGTRFKVLATLDEFASFKIDYGTSTGTYTESTTEETSYNYSTHAQWVGGNNAPLLTAGTTIYYRFDMEDASLNQGYSSEYTYTTQGANVPYITLTGSESINVDVNTTYTELGAVWTDIEDGTGAAIVGGDTVDVNTIGTYVVTYNYTDTDTNAAPQITRTVSVVQPFVEGYNRPYYFGLSTVNLRFFYLGSAIKYKL